MAAQEFSRAAQMYLTGAVEYQQGTEAVRRATSGLDDTVRLVQHLEGRLRSEAEAAWQSARQELLPSQERPQQHQPHYRHGARRAGALRPRAGA